MRLRFQKMRPMGSATVVSCLLLFGFAGGVGVWLAGTRSPEWNEGGQKQLESADSSGSVSIKQRNKSPFAQRSGVRADWPEQSVGQSMIGKLPHVHISVGPDAKVQTSSLVWHGLTDDEVSEEVEASLEHLTRAISLEQAQTDSLRVLLEVAARAPTNAASARIKTLRWLDDEEAKAKMSARLSTLHGEKLALEMIEVLEEMRPGNPVSKRRM